MSLIECKNLTVSYDGKKVINNLSFSVNEGDYLCIVGENGSGKSTLTKAILGLIPINAGSINFDIHFKKNEIGYLPQQTDIQKDFPASIKEIVLSGRLNRHKSFVPFYTAQDKLAASKNIHKLGLCKLSKKSFNELSGGQKQRVLLARALCATEKLLILDEPAAGLDPFITEEFYEIIGNLNKKENITVVMVSHDLECVKKYATHVLHLGDKSCYFTSKNDYFARGNQK